MKLRPGPMDHEPENLKSCSLKAKTAMQSQTVAKPHQKFLINQGN